MRVSTAGAMIMLVAATTMRAASAANAQDGRYAPVLLLWPGGTRGSAMANATLAPRDDESLHYDVAAIGLAPSVVDNRLPPVPMHTASASWQRAGRATLHGVAAVFQSGAVGVGVGARRLAFEGSTLPVAAGRIGMPDSRAASSTALVVGAARDVKGIRAGGAVSVGEDRVGDERSAHTTFDVGITRPVTFFAMPLLRPPGVLQLGLTVQNIGTTSSVGGADVQPPTMVTAGADLEGFPKSVFDISGGASVSVRRDGRVIPRTGWELAWIWLDRHAIAVRAGLRRPELDGQSPVTLGLGLIRDNVSLDYALEPGDRMPVSHRVGVRVR